MNDIEEVYGEHSGAVYRYLLSLCRSPSLAEELTQETFYRALRSLHTYHGGCKISVWLCQIAKHLWYQELDRQRRHGTLELDENLDAALEAPTPDEALHGDKMAVFGAIHRLEEPMREVVYMRLSGEFSFTEIGQLLGRSENWARVTFYRAKQKIVKGLV